MTEFAEQPGVQKTSDEKRSDALIRSNEGKQDGRVNRMYYQVQAS